MCSNHEPDGVRAPDRESARTPYRADAASCACRQGVVATPDCGEQTSEARRGAANEDSDLIIHNPAFRRPACEVVEFCERERSLDEIVAFMSSAAWPKTFVMAPDAFVSMLEGCGCLSLRIYVDGVLYEGNLDDLSDDESLGDEATVTYAYEATRAGRHMAERMRKRFSISATVESDKGLSATFLRVLELCQGESGQSSRQIDAALRAEGLLPLDRSGLPRIFTTYFIDALEQCRALSWQSTWKTTSEGRSYLERVRMGV